MRIVIVIDWFVYYSVELANALADGNNVFLVTRDHNLEISPRGYPVELDDFLDLCLIPEVARDKLRFRRRSWRNIFEIIRLYRKIRSFRPDVIHIQQNTDWRILVLTGLLGFRKTVLTIHDVTLHPGMKKDPNLWINRCFLGRARKIIVHGAQLKEALISKFPLLRNRVHIMPIGIFTLYHRWDDGSVKEEALCLLFFGSISAYKGIDDLIQAGTLIARDLPGVRILIAGAGTMSEESKSRIKNDPHFEIHNEFIPNEDVFKYFQRAAVVVLPYIEASQSAVIPLAFSFGKPVVATRIGSIPEAVEEGRTGFLVPPGEPEALAEAVIRIFKDPDLKAFMNMNVRKKASSDMSWKAVAAGTARVYSSLAEHD
jgi:alpha-maltose-1-phosphate synthase